MRLVLAALCGLALLSGVVSSPAAADVTPIKVGRDKPFKHKPSGIVIAEAAAGIPRVSVGQFDNKQLDVIVDFRDATQSEITTIYVFRNVAGDVPLWFDRIQRTIETKKSLGAVTLPIPAAAFTPAGQTTARGLRAVYSASGSNWKSSAAALTSIGEWYVSVRASSATLTPEQLLARIEQTFAAIRWPKEKAQAAAVAPVAACPTALTQGEDAQPVKDDGALVLMSALTATVGEALGSAGKLDPQLWCRDPFKIEAAGVYRPNGAADRYLIAFQDAGRGIWVAPNGLAGLLQGAKGDAPLSYMVDLIDIDRRSGFGTFATLPSVAQALWLIDHGTRNYSTPTWGKDKTIEINSDALGPDGKPQ